MQIRKRGLCAFDDKRYLMGDGISTLAFGHHSIKAVVETTRANASDVACTFTAQNARAMSIPLCKRKQLPAGQDPGDCAREARRVFAASAVPEADEDEFTHIHPASLPHPSHSVDFRPLAHPASYYGSNKSAPPRVTPNLDELMSFMIDEDSN